MKIAQQVLSMGRAEFEAWAAARKKAWEEGDKGSAGGLAEVAYARIDRLLQRTAAHHAARVPKN